MHRNKRNNNGVECAEERKFPKYKKKKTERDFSQKIFFPQALIIYGSNGWRKLTEQYVMTFFKEGFLKKDFSLAVSHFSINILDSPFCPPGAAPVWGMRLKGLPFQLFWPLSTSALRRFDRQRFDLVSAAMTAVALHVRLVVVGGAARADGGNEPPPIEGSLAWA
jgi:hypothetical protein